VSDATLPSLTFGTAVREIPGQQRCERRTKRIRVDLQQGRHRGRNSLGPRPCCDRLSLCLKSSAAASISFGSQFACTNSCVRLSPSREWQRSETLP
jgi:hypothetical protein